MDFNKSYNRESFIEFLNVGQTAFLPDDFILEEEELDFTAKRIKRVTRIGICSSLGLEVFEVQHNSYHDARVELSKESFRLLMSKSTLDRALIIFVPEKDYQNYRLSLIHIDCELDDNKVRTSYSNPRRYSFVLGKDAKVRTPKEYLIKKGTVKDWDDLQHRFSVEVLTKEFYQELSDWYALAIQVVIFPGEYNCENIDQKDEHRSKNVIRLLTRLLFVWFLKQKGLIPWELFDEDYLKDNLIKNFDPQNKNELYKFESSTSIYYKSILQNLFFATLNCPIVSNSSEDQRERGFRRSNWYGQGFGTDFLMRYKNLFSNPEHFLELVNKQVPFLNGGLFDCLDDKQNKSYIDGFSDNLLKPNLLIVPDFLFFGDEGKEYDLSEFYGDKKKKKTTVYALLDILKKYNFTIEENTPFDQEVSLDPELLGKVFENLLASYNPETKSTARKQTGSFYTPREIVQYMVDESIIAHLKRTVSSDYEEEYRKLISYTDEEYAFSEEMKIQIIKSIQSCKVLDPACGSGAFPVGILQQMVHILSQLDSDNEIWKTLIYNESMKQLGTSLKDNSVDECKVIQADIKRNFDDSINRPDYARKLYLIEKCIYGIDIQPIAVQISKLRFFISLVVDQKPTSNNNDNFGIRPLPNLESKFVAANTLISLDKGDINIFDNERISKLQSRLIQFSHRIFGAKSIKTKNRYKAKVVEIQLEISQWLEKNGDIGNEEARLMRQWKMFDQNSSSPFFHSQWMFGVKNGFDIVIGNPPYGTSIKGDYRKQILSSLGKVPDYEIYYYFIEVAKKVLVSKGFLSYIIPNTFLFNTFAANYRLKLLDEWKLHEVLDCSKFSIFENATVRNTINLWQFKSSDLIGYRNTTSISNFNQLAKKPRMHIKKESLINMNKNWALAFSLSTSIIHTINSIKDKTQKLLHYFPNISQGLIAYDKYKGQSDEIINSRAYHSLEYIEGYKKWLHGEDVTSYRVQWNKIEYFNYCVGVANPRNPIFFNGKRLLIREITNPSIYAGITDEELYFNPSIIVVLDSALYSIEVLLAILNSKLATFYHFNSSAKASKGAFPKILVKDVKEFPIPKIDNKDKFVIENLVNYIYYLNSSETQINVNLTNNALKRFVLDVLDSVVYELYFRKIFLEKKISVISVLYDDIQQITENSINDQINCFFDKCSDYSSLYRNRMLLMPVKCLEVKVIKEYKN